MKLAYADPPYPGKAHLYESHPDYAGEVDHRALIRGLLEYDGWALSTSAESLHWLLPEAPEARVLAWVKHTVRVSWEPVIVCSARPPDPSLRDWIQVEPEGFQWRPKDEGYVIGQKPEAFCRWVFGWLGAEPGDELADLFPGSGAVGRAWEAWSSQPGLPFGLSRSAAGRAGRRARARALRDEQEEIEGWPPLSWYGYP